MECTGQSAQRECSSPPASWWQGSCRRCDPVDDRGKYGLPRGVILTPDRECPECGQTWPEDDVCHRCGGKAEPVAEFWGLLGLQPPTLSGLAGAVGAMIDYYVAPDQNGQPDRASVADLIDAAQAHGEVAKWWHELADARTQSEWLGAQVAIEERRLEAEKDRPKGGGRRG